MLKENLIMLRKLNNLSQEEVAEKIGISRQAYAKWENGNTTPDVEKCMLLAELYNTTIDSLIKTERTDDSTYVPPAPKGKNIWGTVTINERGQIVIPKPVRDKFDLSTGKRLVVLSDDDKGIALVPSEVFENQLKRIQEAARKSN